MPAIHQRNNTARRALTAARLDLEQRLRVRESLEVERYTDPLDEALQLQQREQAAVVASSDTRLLHAIKDALERLDDGTFGICVECGDEIAPKRLAAAPWAPRCRDCQEIAEQAEDAVRAGSVCGGLRE